VSCCISRIPEELFSIATLSGKPGSPDELDNLETFWEKAEIVEFFYVGEIFVLSRHLLIGVILPPLGELGTVHRDSS